MSAVSSLTMALVTAPDSFVASVSLTLEHRFTRPYTPRTNGKAERFIQTALRESASLALTITPSYAPPNFSLDPASTTHRPHAILNHAVPISRSGLDRNNLLRHHRGSILRLRRRIRSDSAQDERAPES